MFDDYESELQSFPCCRHAEAMREEVYVLGAEEPNREWILTDYDVWFRNPFFQGEPGPHPED